MIGRTLPLLPSPYPASSLASSLSGGRKRPQAWVWPRQTAVAGAGHHLLPCGPHSPLNDLAGIGVTVLDARDWSVDSTVVEAIGAKCPALERLYVSGARLSYPPRPLAHLSRLTHLVFVRPDRGHALRPGSLAALARSGVVQNALFHLDLTSCGSGFDDYAATVVAPCFPSLRVLLIRHTACADAGALAIGANCHKLARLDVSFTQITGKGLNAIMEGCPDIRDLHAVSLEHTSARKALVLVTPSQTSTFCNRLVTLNLRDCKSVRNTCCFWIAKYASLTHLDISGCEQVSDAGLITISVGLRRSVRTMILSNLPLITTVGANRVLAGLKRMHTCDFSGAPQSTITLSNSFARPKNYTLHLLHP